MTTRYHVFYGAPSEKDLRKPSSKLRWQTVTTCDTRSGPLTLPPATLAAASRRISMMYENVIFGESQRDDEAWLGDAAVGNEEPQPEGQTTLITWAPTTQGPDETTRSRAEVTFLRPSVTISYFRSQKETQESQETESFNESNASSIAQFPAFDFSLHALTPLDTLISQAQAARARGMPKASLKKGPDAGKEVSLLKLILGDESGGICKLAAWREIAEDWAGLNPEVSAPSVKKGDIVLLENILASWEGERGSTTATIPVSLSASPQLKSRMDICYRTMPSVPQDARIRPDLRLGLSDAAVRKVASVVRWFEDVAGLA
ncbi:hypothetical protein PYCCODRAFT_176577 [Trametes coccinea BRFM310]|uniref:Uncharacterized protein n=1 Tax=Trametes coccinea (strain BRFM310) TaxID=1353009 RepID=A0A1Y2IV72_TRAC3|nr:hypothetical protein PYCCODRAFT_176577 [Trametes coccinea BRFM310]